MAAPTDSKNFSALTSHGAAPAAGDEFYIQDASEGSAINKPKRIAFSAFVTNLQPLDSVLTNTTASYTTAEETKLAAVEALADVTDATNVSAAGAPLKSAAEVITGVHQFNAVGSGAIGAFDVEVGDTDGTPTYGMMQIGDATFGRTSHNTASLDLDGSLLLWNNTAPATSNIEFAFAESSNSIRFAIPKSGAGNATYNPRSMLIAGPAPADDTMVTVGYWQVADSIFDNLVCDTGTDGADLGVQNDLEVEGDIFTDTIKGSTDNTDVTITPHGTGRTVVKDINAPAPINNQTGTTYAIVLGDAGKMIIMNNGSANTATIPANASVAFPVGSELYFMQLGAGATTIAITSDTLSVESSLTLVLAGQYAVATAKKITSTQWVLSGNLTAS